MKKDARVSIVEEKKRLRKARSEQSEEVGIEYEIVLTGR